ncbi:3-oxoacyl-[acyl-carrier protein] reductase [Tangfeifania diversioriginum]|uniref:3-oxoacyl-[acyl-carrier protein] reductase n=1 Tax=Tangfeifania diversioriginum TaxID=1168035 RepID=A0A1M6LMN1_9BACT|nr:SDR family oxidoreductase [Tangfeifania diversioriginum]SHJ72352.1 3-oxoacyl-[acyl-carrier protein] reductase [Tangfeifania diversioriginum]
MDLQIEGKIFMVAASSKGLGYGIARELAKNGATVCIASRTKKEVEKAAETLRSETGSTIHATVFDAANDESITSWVTSVERAFERIDGLVVNAGGPPPGNFDDFSDDDWEAAFNLTLMSAVRLIRGVLPVMRAGGGGAILTVTSMSVKEPVDRLLLSNVFRSGVTSLVKSLSNELAGENIRVNNLLPGRINTDRLKALDQNISEKTGTPVQEVRQKNEANIPIGRYGTTEEFGKAGAFLLSPAASYITGSSLAVDGGSMKTVW